ncbi:MAG: tetratricopeptide repeat protein [Bacteroidales bacterium]|nr:tetratricopeptide repeat protein [Bacteroidales bacterium]MDD2619034.1 tetratricopeptide repeat protein [Bacteroidales bacterium]MDD4641827.1 tetratricopeptide repeat protein [Bacteroidales bacterium]
MKAREDDGIRALVRRFEQQRSSGQSLYFDVDEFDLIADYYLDRGRTNKLSEVVSSALRIHPNSTVIHLKRAILFVETGNPLKALHLLDRLPEQEETDFIRAAAYFKLKRQTEGLALLKGMVDKEQYDKDLACLEAVNILSAENLYKEALDFVQKGLEHNPNNTDLMSEGAFCAEQLNDVQLTEQYYRMLLVVDVYSYENWFNLGQVLFGQERYEEACKAYDFALVSNPRFMPAVLQMGHACFQMEHYDDAAKYYLDYLLAAIEESLPSAEGNSIDDLMVFVAEAFEKAEQYESAMEWYEHALTTNPENLQAHTGMGICYLELKNYKQSLHFLEKALKLDNKQSEIWVYLAEVLVNMDKDDQAIVAYLHALSLNPSQAEVLFALGNLYYDQQKFELALKYYSDAELLDATFPNIHLYKALAYARKGDMLQADSSLKLALLSDAHAKELFDQIIGEEQE